MAEGTFDQRSGALWIKLFETISFYLTQYEGAKPVLCYDYDKPDSLQIFVAVVAASHYEKTYI